MTSSAAKDGYLEHYGHAKAGRISSVRAAMQEQLDSSNENEPKYA